MPLPPTAAPVGRSPAPTKRLDDFEVEDILRMIQAKGAKSALEHCWSRLEGLHEEEKVSCSDVARIFEASVVIFSDACTRHRNLRPDEGLLPLSTRLVQLFSNFVCQRMPELTPEEITTFVVSLTSASIPMDEFWLFMLAKRVQDTAANFGPEQITTIARRYADKSLEDAEFFAALAQRVVAGLSEFTLPQLANFLLSCGKLKFLDEDLSRVAFPLFVGQRAVLALDGMSLSSVVSAAALLDVRAFHPLQCCRLLAENPRQLRRAVENADLAMGLTLAVVYFRHAAGLHVLLPHLLVQMSNVKRRFMVLLASRRAHILGLCAAFGVPCAWPLPLIRQVHGTVAHLKAAAEIQARENYEPVPSSFHLEVVAVLRILDVGHTVEHPQNPFCLDLMITPEQIRLANLEQRAELPPAPLPDIFTQIV